jgi:hypothetical protein
MQFMVKALRIAQAIGLAQSQQQAPSIASLPARLRLLAAARAVLALGSRRSGTPAGWAAPGCGSLSGPSRLNSKRQPGKPPCPCTACGSDATRPSTHRSRPSPAGSSATARRCSAR